MTEWRDDDLDARLWEGQGGEQIAGDALEPSTCNAAKEAKKMRKQKVGHAQFAKTQHPLCFDELTSTASCFSLLWQYTMLSFLPQPRAAAQPTCFLPNPFFPQES